MSICTSCNQNNEESARFCENCGSQLQVPEAAAPETQAPPLEQETVVGSLAPVLAHLIIERGDSAGTRFQLGIKEALIGRWDADNGVFPEVDLDRHDADAKVSRRHARVIFKDGGFFIEDLGSTNGTFLNRGKRLIPGVPQALSDDDEVIVGKTFLRFKMG